MKVIRTLILIYLVIYLLAMLYPWYSCKVFIDTYRSIQIGEPFDQLASRLQSDHRIEIRRGAETTTGLATNTLLFFGASDDAVDVSLITRVGLLTSKSIVGSSMSEEGMQSWSWIRAYLQTCLRTVVPLGCLYLLVWKWHRLKRVVKALLWIAVFVGGIFATADFIYLGLIYVILVARLII